MTLRDRIARAIAPYEAEPTSATLATVDRVIEALRELDKAMIDNFLNIYILSVVNIHPEMTKQEYLDALRARLRATYAAIWSEK
jgi:hypothetical protein